jgi:hypothetical protein
MRWSHLRSQVLRRNGRNKGLAQRNVAGFNNLDLVDHIEAWV